MSTENKPTDQVESVAIPSASPVTLPKPYYDQDGITIYHGDCRDILPALPMFDLLLTDPPFGVGNFVQVTGNVRGERVTWNESTPDESLIQLCHEKAKKHIVWGSNYLNCFNGKGGAIVWVKNQPMPDFSKADIASCSFYKKVEIVEITWTNFVNSKVTDHPCERPVKLYSWCIKYAGDVETILDPFAGSGSSGVAARDMGKQATLIEKEERYCEAQAKRLLQGVLF